MHEYTVAHHDRKNTYYALAAASGLIGSLASALVAVAASWGIILAAPSGLLLFGLVFILFDRFCWKWPLFFKHGIVKIPNLNGLWNGHVESSAITSNTIPISITVHQTYTRIRIRLETSKSMSLSQMAAFQMEDPSCYSLRWEYLAEFRSEPGMDPKRHYGVTKLILKINDHDFRGEQHGNYYTELDRDTYGQMVIARESTRGLPSYA